MAKAGPRKIERYGERFKATAVKLSSWPGVQVKDVAVALDIHPFMLSLWRKQVRERVIVARASKLDVETTAELRRRSNGFVVSAFRRASVDCGLLSSIRRLISCAQPSLAYRREK